MSDKEKFPWGKVREVHKVGAHVIDGKYNRIVADTDKILFSVEPKENHYFYEDTLDKALIASVCFKYDGINTRLPEYIFKALGMEA